MTTELTTGLQPELTESYTLQFPYKCATGEILEAVSLRPLTVKDLRVVRRQFKNSSDWDEGLVARMCGLVAEDLDNMDMRDFRVLQDRFQQRVGLADPGSSD